VGVMVKPNQSDGADLVRQWVQVCKIEDVPEGRVMGFEVTACPVAIYNLGGRIFSTDGLCTHAKVSLSKGRIIGRSVECPLHVACFDIESGKGLGAPITRDLQTYQVAIMNGYILISMPVPADSL